MKKSRISAVLEIVFALYVCIIIYMTIWTTLKNAWIIPFFFIITLWMIKRFETVCLRFLAIERIDSSPFSMKLGLIIFMLIFTGQLLFWLAYYPGGFNLDAYGQWDQVHGLIRLNNWHPILTTAFYWVLTRIVDSLAFCIFVQITFFSFTVTVLIMELSKRPVPSIFLGIIVLYLSVNPAIVMNNVCLIKDVPFTILICWVVWCFLKIERTNGEWLKWKTNISLLCILTVMLTLVRHNAIFFTVPFFIVLAFSYKNDFKRIVVTAILSLGILSLIEGPLLSMLQIQQHSNVAGEAVGIPMAAMVNAMLNDPENCPEQTKEFLYGITDQTEWEYHYITGEWDSCKWEFGGTELLKDESLENILSLFFKTMIKCPDAVYASVSENTRVVWQVFGYTDWKTWIYIEENDYGIRENYNRLCSTITTKIELLSETVPGTFFSWEIGPCMLVLFLCLILMSRTGRLQQSGCIVALLLYNLLTMCLLCGPSYRYFYVNQVLVLPIIAITFYKQHSIYQ